MSENRKHFAATEKMAILRRHLLEQVPVSELCNEPCATRTRDNLLKRQGLYRLS